MTSFRIPHLSAWLLSLVVLSGFLPGRSEAQCFKKQSYHDCLLEGLKGTTSDIAAQTVKRACAEKFPGKAKKTMRLSSPSATAKVTGEASVYYGTFTGSLYNSSQFYLAGATLSVQPKGTDISGEKSLSRHLAVELEAPQNSTDSFCIFIDKAFANSIRNGFDWSVVDISVVKEE